MNIGLDYDDTFTRDPIGWAAMASFMRQRGHKVYLVTWRDAEETNEDIQTLTKNLDGVYFTSRTGKERFMYAQGIRIDVWIDDNPRAIIQDMDKY